MPSDLLERSRLFLEYLEEWRRGLKPFSLSRELGEPGAAAVFSADMVVGFCHSGSLASPRVGSLVQPVVDLFQRAWRAGMRHFVLAQDTHHQAAQEFGAFPPHCVRGTEESQTIPELRGLPFADRFTIVEKNSLSPAVGTGLDGWLDSHPELRTCIVVGDCTDLCTYSLAMHLRLRANALNVAGVRVIVPANAVETYDLPVEMARKIGAPAHPGDLFHLVFLYHMHLNGCQVARELVD
ncbi:MAG: cysteine hydrolase [Chloroflexi bacterium]|nr:cysteine hydrolase [Chloroflexota bacterium]